jgi:hypothetical protein
MRLANNTYPHKLKLVFRLPVATVAGNISPLIPNRVASHSPLCGVTFAREDIKVDAQTPSEGPPPLLFRDSSFAFGRFCSLR